MSENSGPVKLALFSPTSYYNLCTGGVRVVRRGANKKELFNGQLTSQVTTTYVKYLSRIRSYLFVFELKELQCPFACCASPYRSIL